MKRLKLFTVFHGFCWIRIVLFDTDPDSGSSQFLIQIRIQGNDTDSTNPDPPHWLKQLLLNLRQCWGAGFFLAAADFPNLDILRPYP